MVLLFCSKLSGGPVQAHRLEVVPDENAGSRDVCPLILLNFAILDEHIVVRPTSQVFRLYMLFLLNSQETQTMQRILPYIIHSLMLKYHTSTDMQKKSEDRLHDPAL